VLIAKVVDQCLALFPTSKGTTLRGISCLISSIVQGRFVTLIAQYVNRFDEFLKSALRTEDAEIQGILLHTLNLKNEKALQALRQKLNIVQDRFSYKPAWNGQSPADYIDLRNQSSICYMNALFQQLFFTFPFRYLLLTTPLETLAQKRLQRIFAELLISGERYSATHPFCGCWKGWGKQLINPREEQDAVEFLQFILD
jgi:hypothetical protein